MHRNANKKQQKRSNHSRVGPLESADSLTVRLRYPVRGSLSAAAVNVGKRWSVNAAYDVDPTLGSTATPGFTEYAALYTYYRVHTVTSHFECSNLDNIGTSLYWFYTNVDPGITGANWHDYAASALGGSAILAPFYSGKGTHVIHMKRNVSRILGMSTNQADSFRSVTASTPSDLAFFGVGIYSNAGTNFTNGVSYEGYIEMEIRFYARNEILTSYYLKPSPIELEAQRILFKEKRAVEMMAKLASQAQADELYKSQKDKELQETVTKLRARSSSVPVLPTVRWAQ